MHPWGCGSLEKPLQWTLFSCKSSLSDFCSVTCKYWSQYATSLQEFLICSYVEMLLVSTSKPSQLIQFSQRFWLRSDIQCGAFRFEQQEEVASCWRQPHKMLMSSLQNILVLFIQLSVTDISTPPVKLRTEHNWFFL